MKDIREGVGPKTYFRYNTIFLNGCGIWPFQSTTSKAFFRFLWIIQEIVLTVAEMIKLIEVRENLDLVIEAIPPMLYNRITEVKYINGIVNRRKMAILLEKIQEDWNNLTDDSEIRILSRYAGTGKLINLLYIVMVYSAVVSCCLLPLAPKLLDIVNPLNDSRPVKSLFMVEFYIDEEKYFLSILTHAYISALLSAIPLLAVDMFYMNCIYHICGMITILGTRIDNAFKDSESKSISEESKYKQLCNCIDMHQTIFEFCDDINNAFSTSFLFVLFFNMTLMSFTGVATVIKLNDLSKLNDTLRFIVFTIAEIFHLFCFNFMGQNILTAIEALDQNIYGTEWYDVSIKTQILIKVMILRNYKPTIMQAVLFPLCLQTFTSVMKTSMSYFTVIKSTR